MTETLSTARSGEPIVLIGGVPLHSRYAPALEAERYIDTQNISPRFSFFLLLEPGLGYLVAALRKKRPDAVVLSLHFSDFYDSEAALRAATSRPDAAWSPGCGIGIETFLETHISDFEAGSVKIIDWKPAFSAYGRQAAEIAAAAAGFIKRANANARTSAHFGRRWVRNAIKNAAEAKGAFCAERGDAPVLVAASGPGLEKCLEAILIAQRSAAAFVMAVSSAAAALAEAGIEPDLVVAADGGGWASFHLHRSFRTRSRIAFSLSAALPSALLDNTLIPLADDSLWQSMVCGEARLQAIRAPQRGTVAATAVDLALLLGSGPVYLAGFDLGVRDGKTHARPNALDRFHEDDASRFAPSASEAFVRYLSARDGGALDVYAKWMARRFVGQKRLRILGDASSELAFLPRFEMVEAAVASRFPIFRFVPSAAEEPRVKRRKILTALHASIDAESRQRTHKGYSSSVRSISAELCELLCPEEYAQLVARGKKGDDTDAAQSIAAKKIYQILEEMA